MIDILDINDNNPVFRPDGVYSFTVPENVTPLVMGQIEVCIHYLMKRL